jgi:uncharacterized repeat protein (TIGR01451 family)
MKNLLSKLPKKLVAGVAALAIIAGVASTAFAAFGPEGRPTMNWTGDDTKGADHVVFNSFVNNPVWGDERDFVRAAVEQRDDKYKDPLADVKDGDTVNVIMFVHNNADSALNADGSGVALNTTVKADIPTGVTNAQEIKGYISADNATPQTIFDTVSINGADKFAMEYVPGSVHISGNHINQDLPNADIRTGFKIGDQLDGKFKGCFEFVQYVTFKVKISKPSISIEKTERKLGQTAWVKDMTAKPGDTIEYRLKITNTGKSDLTNITVGDRLPPYLTYVPGTTRLYNKLTPAEGTLLNDGIVPGALRLNATYQPTAVAYIVFQAKVSTDIANKECGSPRLRNVAATHADQVPGDVEDTADVVVETGKVCTTPTYACESATAVLNGKTVTVTVKAPVSGGASVKQYAYDFGDKTAPLVTDKNPAQHTYAEVGTYKITVVVTFNNGQSTDTKTCVASVTIPTTPTTLVNTGAGSTIGIFAAVSAAGAVLHNVLVRRRVNAR